MQIPLDHPIWQRLYGPYGVQDTNTELGQLMETWSQPRADFLYWERLHHQDTLYPVTYAALPWLWAHTPKNPENLAFFSHVLSCAMYLGSGETYQGLALCPKAHAHCWLPTEAHITNDDIPALKSLEDWFSNTCAEISKTCLDAIGSGLNKSDAVHLISGPSVYKGASELADVALMFADGHRLEVILQELPPLPEGCFDTLNQLLPILDNHQPELAADLRTFANQNRPQGSVF